MGPHPVFLGIRRANAQEAFAENSIEKTQGEVGRG